MPILIKNKEDLEKMSVAALYSKLTGKSWSSAKKDGLTDGSYKQNASLRRKLLKQVKDDAGVDSGTKEKKTKDGWFYDEPIKEKKKEAKKEKKEKINDFSRAGSFGAAFNAANELLGENAVFRYKGKMFTTDLGKASIKKKATSNDTEEEEELPVEEVKIARNLKNDSGTEDLVNQETQRAMAEALAPYEDDVSSVYARRAMGKPSWITYNSIGQYKKGGILPYKYKNNSGGDDDKKKKKKNKTSSKTPKKYPAYNTAKGNLKASSRLDQEDTKSGEKERRLQRLRDFDAKEKAKKNKNKQ